MKTLNLIFVLIILQSITFKVAAQTRQWNIVLYNEEFSPTHTYPDWTTHIYRTANNVEIEGKEYVELYKSFSEDFSGAVYIGAIRDEDGKTYFIDTYNTEHLLYDFNVSMGDVFPVFRLDGAYTVAEVVSIGQLRINETVRKTITVAYGCNYNNETEIWYEYEDTWIEGIGSRTHGLLNQGNHCATGYYISSQLLCFREQEQFVWRNSMYNTCFFNMVETPNNIKESKKNDFEIYPNILTSEGGVSIKADFMIKQVSISDFQGRVVLKKEANSLGCELKLNDFKNGFYIVLINNSYPKKLLINR